LKSKPAPWRVTQSRITYSDKWITLRSDDCMTADGIPIAPYHVLEYPNWINVVPITTEGQLLLVREYRHGRQEVLTGLVSGAEEPGDLVGGDEPSLQAARRELLEETGYGAGAFHKLLTSYPNPANHNNLVTSWLVLDAHPVGSQQFDIGEDIEILLTSFSDVLRQVQSGELMMQAMHVAALFAAHHWLQSRC
jgi:ADP-ribose pyrophosphatase